MIFLKGSILFAFLLATSAAALVWRASLVITNAPEGKVAKKGENVAFLCDFEGDPEPTVTWTKDNVAIKNDSRFHIVIRKGSTELEIEKVIGTDAGNYMVTLKNSYGIVSAWAELVIQDVHDPPVITKAPKGKVAREAETVIFSCDFEGDPEPTVTWTKDGVAIKTDSRIHIVTRKGFTEVEIEQIIGTDAGKYKVALNNSYGYAWAWAGLVIYNDPPVITKARQRKVVKKEETVIFSSPPGITKAPKGKVAKKGETVIFSCEFEGDPEPTVTWTKDGVAIKTESRIHIVIRKGFTEVEIEQIIGTDAGKYKVTLTNSHGYALAWAELVISNDESDTKTCTFTLQSNDTRYGYLQRHGYYSPDNLDLLKFSTQRPASRFRFLSNRAIQEVNSGKCLNLVNAANLQLVLKSNCYGSVATWFYTQSRGWMESAAYPGSCLSRWNYGSRPPKDVVAVPGLGKCAQNDKFILKYSCKEAILV